MVKWTCLVCNGTKRFPTKKGYSLWSDQPEALVEFFDYTPKPIEEFQETGKLVEALSSNSTVDHKTLSPMDVSESNEEIDSTEKECNSKIEDQNDLGEDKNVKSTSPMGDDQSIIGSSTSLW